MKGQMNLFPEEYIKDSDCTKDTPVVHGKPDTPIYGTGARIKPRVPGRQDTEHFKSIYLDSLLPLEEYDLIAILLSGGKDSIACYYKLLELGVPKDRIEFWHHDIDGGHPNRIKEMMKMLILPIKKKWYDMILSGEKTEEYREIKPYYDSRFESVFGCQWLFRGIDGVGDTTPPEKEIIFRNGYSRSSRQAKATCTLTKGTGNPEWGAEPGVKYYVLHIKKIQEA